MPSDLHQLIKDAFGESEDENRREDTTMSSDMLQRIKDVFGVAEPSASDESGSDLELPVKVTLHEAYLGITRKFTVTLSDGQKHTMELEIPPGVDTGTRVRFRGYGVAGQAGGAAR